MLFRSNPAYRTAVGKALLSRQLTTIAEVEQWIGSRQLDPKTPNTLTTAEALAKDFDASRARGYAIDDQENELGVNCVALPIFMDGSLTPVGAISVSAVSFRCPLARLVDAVPDIRATIERHLGANALG